MATLEEILNSKKREQEIVESSDYSIYENTINENRAATINREESSPRKDELNYDEYGELLNTDSFMTGFKSLYNAVAPSSMQTDIYRNGKRIDYSNKSSLDPFGSNVFEGSTADDISEYIDGIKEDPNASHVLYKQRIFDGFDENGKDKFLIKYGTSKKGLADRQKDQEGRAVEILWEKRTPLARDLEEHIQSLSFDADVDTLSIGRDSKTLRFGSGSTEISNKDVLGRDYENNISIKELKENYDLSVSNTVRYNEDRRFNDKNNTMLQKYMLLGDYGDAIQYGAVRLANEVGDLGATVLGAAGNAIGLENTLRDNVFDKWSDDAARNTGYNKQDFDAAIGESVAKFNSGDYVSALLGNVGVLSEAVFQSAPDMALMFVSGGSSAVAKAGKAKDYYSLMKTSDKLEKAGKKADSLRVANKAETIKTEIFKTGSLTEKEFVKLSSMTTISKGLRNAPYMHGFNTLVSSYTNKVVEDRRANGDTDVTPLEIASIFATQYLAMSIDKLAISSILKTPQTSEIIKKAFGAIPTSGKGYLAAKVLQKSSQIAKASGAETAQEYTQSWTEILGKDLGVNGKTISEVFNDKNNQDDALGGAIAGFAAGGATRLIGELNTGRKDLFNMFSDTGSTNIESPANDDWKNHVSEEDFSSESVPFDQKKYSLMNHLDETSEHSVSGEVSDLIISASIVNGITNSNKHISPNELRRESLLKMIKTVSYSGNPQSSKIIKDVISKSEFLSNADKASLERDFIKFDSEKELIDALYSGNENAINESKRGSDLQSSTNEKNPYMRENQDAGDNKENVGPVNNLKGNLTEQIKKIDEKIRDYNKNDISTKALVEVKNTLMYYNTTDEINPKYGKKGSNVSSEVSSIGFVEPDGRVSRPSISAYKSFLPALFSSSDETIESAHKSGFITKDRFKRFLKSRSKNVTDKKEFLNLNLSESMFFENENLLSTVNDIKNNLSQDSGINEKEKIELLEELNEYESLLYKASESSLNKISGKTRAFHVEKKINPNAELGTPFEAKAIVDGMSKINDIYTLQEYIKKSLSSTYFSPEASYYIHKSLAVKSSEIKSLGENRRNKKIEPDTQRPVELSKEEVVSVNKDMTDKATDRGITTVVSDEDHGTLLAMLQDKLINKDNLPSSDVESEIKTILRSFQAILPTIKQTSDLMNLLNRFKVEKNKDEDVKEDVLDSDTGNTQDYADENIKDENSSPDKNIELIDKIEAEAPSLEIKSKSKSSQVDSNMLSEVNKIISNGNPKTNAHKYALENKDNSNTGEYNDTDIVGVITPSKKSADYNVHIEKTLSEIRKAVEAGSTLVTHVGRKLDSNVKKLLIELDYELESNSGYWSKKDVKSDDGFKTLSIKRLNAKSLENDVLTLSGKNIISFETFTKSLMHGKSLKSITESFNIKYSNSDISYSIINSGNFILFNPSQEIIDEISSQVDTQNILVVESDFYSKNNSSKNDTNEEVQRELKIDSIESKTESKDKVELTSEPETTVEDTKTEDVISYSKNEVLYIYASFSSSELEFAIENVKPKNKKIMVDFEKGIDNERLFDSINDTIRGMKDISVETEESSNMSSVFDKYLSGISKDKSKKIKELMDRAKDCKNG